MNRRAVLMFVLLSTVLFVTARGQGTRVDLSKEKVGATPTMFEPMMGTWVIAQDGPDKVIKVDGVAYKASLSASERTFLESARKFYGTTNEELMDNAKQFAVFPIAVLRSVNNFTDGTIAMKFKTVSGDADRTSGILFNVKPNGDWLTVRYQDTERNVVLWEFHNGVRRAVRRGQGAMTLDRAAWHDMVLTVDGANLKTEVDGNVVLEYVLGTMPGPGRNGQPPNADLIPDSNPVLRPPVTGKIGLWAKGDSTSFFKDYVVTPKK